MPYTINVVVTQEDGRATLTEPQNTQKMQLPTGPTQKEKEFSLKSVTNFGVGAITVGAVGSAATSRVGAYTENNLRQKNINNGLLFGALSAGMLVNPALGGTAALAILGLKYVDEAIEMRNTNIRAEYRRQLTGNTAETGNRWKGKKG